MVMAGAGDDQLDLAADVMRRLARQDAKIAELAAQAERLRRRVLDLAATLRSTCDALADAAEEISRST